MSSSYSKHNAPSTLNLEGAIDQFRKDLAPSIGRLVAGRIGVRPWVHDLSLPEDENLQFLKSLNLPASSPSSQDKPSLLLHDLGCLAADPDYTYITQIFKPGYHTLLVNTSGAGKTRILLEGLCRHWGFYFTAQVTVGFVLPSLGSHDLGDAIYGRLLQSPNFTERLSQPIRAGEALDPGVFADRLTENTKIAAYLFQSVLLARLILFEQFLSIMNTQGLHATSVLKQRWLLLQIDPWILEKGDVFDSLADVIISHDDNTQVQNLISMYWHRILNGLNAVTEPTQNHVDEASHLFVVVDEAQDAVEAFPDAFRSHFTDITEADSRPVLRELINCWFTTMVKLHKNILRMGGRLACTFIITGTGISRDMMQEALSSSFFKSQPLVTAHTTGGLDTPEAQLKYIKKYLPVRFLSSPQGRALLCRLWYWLGGRFRFTAEYLALLIQDGLRRPHILLNAYIKKFSNIIPTDSLSFVRNEPDFPEFPKITFAQVQYEKLLKRHNMLTTVKDIVYHYLRRSLLPDSAQILGDDESLFVQYGFARYRTRNSFDGDRAEVCEPLILLATAVWMNSRHENLHKTLSNELGNDSTSKNGFEDYLVYYFTRVFEKPTPLGLVFDFDPKDIQLSQYRATLVAVHRSEIDEEIVDFSKTTFGHREAAISLSGCIGENVKTSNRLQEWLYLQKHTAFCFPPLTMGPDILFVLQLDTPDGFQYIWVAVQAKYILGGENPAEFVSKAELVHAIRTVTPNRFYLKNGSGPADESRSNDKRNTVFEALDNLPHRESRLAGRHSVLRVIAVFPPEPNFLAALDIADPDGRDGHPLVSLNHAYIMSQLSKEHPTNKLRNVKDDHLQKIANAAARPRTHPMTTMKLKRLEKLIFPSNWDHEFITKLPVGEIENYLECFRLLLGAEHLPERGKGERSSKVTRVKLLQEQLQAHFEAGGLASVKEAVRDRNSSSRRISQLDADGDSQMGD